MEADRLIDQINGEHTPYEEVCRIAVKLGGMNMAWVGAPDKQHRQIVPMASYGVGNAYLESLVVSTHHDLPEGLGTCGTAYRERRSVIEIHGAPSMDLKMGSRQGLPFGWQSSASFPVVIGDSVVSVLTVYSTDPHTFGPDVINLLEQLAAGLNRAAVRAKLKAKERALQAQIQRSEETYRTLFETVQQGVIYQNAEGLIMAANPAAERILGVSQAQLQEGPTHDPMWASVLSDGRPMPPDQHPGMRAIAAAQPVTDAVLGVRNPSRDSVTWIRINDKPIFKKDSGQLDYVYAIFDDITEMRRLQSELQIQAQRDDLTGLFNRRYFFAQAEQEITRAQRYGHPLSVLMLDIDHFKRINDTYGHPAGDEVLKYAARAFESVLRDFDLLGRIGGEEFVVLLPETDSKEAFFAAERIRKAVAQSDFYVGANHAPIKVTISIGLGALVLNSNVANNNGGDASLTTLLQNADTALYQSKQNGRNRVSEFSPL